MNDLERMLEDLDKTTLDGCWLRTKWISRSNGYASFYLLEGRTRVGAHRAAYELMVGPIPVGYHVDHLCHGWDDTCFQTECLHRRCVNPAHLEAVTPQMNRIRSRASEGNRVRMIEREVCPRGHQLTEDNRYGLGQCRKCDRKNRALARQRRVGAVTQICGFVSMYGNACQRQLGHDGRHHGEKPKFKYTP